MKEQITKEQLFGQLDFKALYGKKIPYLDLSIMWNAWLDLKVTEQDYEQEAIEGGEHDKTKISYNNLMSESIKEMYRVLRFDRWMSFVFGI